MIDWLIVGVYGTFLAIAVVAYLLSGFVFLGIGYIDNYYQDRYSKKRFLKSKVTVEDSDNLANAA